MASIFTRCFVGLGSLSGGVFAKVLLESCVVELLRRAANRCVGCKRVHLGFSRFAGNAIRASLQRVFLFINFQCAVLMCCKKVFSFVSSVRNEDSSLFVYKKDVGRVFIVLLVLLAFQSTSLDTQLCFQDRSESTSTNRSLASVVAG